MKTVYAVYLDRLARALVIMSMALTTSGVSAALPPSAYGEEQADIAQSDDATAFSPHTALSVRDNTLQEASTTVVASAPARNTFSQPNAIITETSTPAPTPEVVVETSEMATVNVASSRAGDLFLENLGQVGTIQDVEVGAQPRFYVRGDAGTIYLAQNGMWITALDEPAPSNTLNALTEGIGTTSQPAATATPMPASPEPHAGVSLRLTFVGAKPNPEIVGIDPVDTHISFFYGSDPSQWRVDVPAYQGVRYLDLYPGYDLDITSVAGQWEWQLIPNASPKTGQSRMPLQDVRLRVEGADGLILDGDRFGIETAVGDLSLPLLGVDDGGDRLSSQTIPDDAGIPGPTITTTRLVILRDLGGYTSRTLFCPGGRHAETNSHRQAPPSSPSAPECPSGQSPIARVELGDRPAGVGDLSQAVRATFSSG